MTLKEILKSQGMTEEQIETVVGEMKQNKIFTASEENLDVRYSKLKGQHDTLTAQHGEATALIEQLRSGAKDGEALQAKLAEYERKTAELQAKLDSARLDAAMDRALTKAGARAADLDYLKFQWGKKGEITLDDNGDIRGVEDAVAAMKTQYPGQFEKTGAFGGDIEANPLPQRNTTGAGITKEEFNRMGYQSRLKLKQEQPEIYAQMTGKEAN